MAGTVTSRRMALHLALAGMVLCALASAGGAATVVRFETILGTFDVELYDANTPLTVDNFLNYVRRGDYDNSIFHRLVHDFVLQGGGQALTDAGDLVGIPTDPPVLNEPGISNTRGTIAMAKIEDQPNSATSEFFFNLVDNSFPLDVSNGGFTVFGGVIRDGMAVVDLLASQPTADELSEFGFPNEMPLIVSGDDRFFEVVYSITIVGDLNGDGRVDQLDVSPFVLALTDPDAYAAQYPDLDPLLLGDIDASGALNCDDVKAFLDLLVGGPGASAVPEPATLMALTAGACLALLRRRT